jgi:hypothetical protein
VKEASRHAHAPYVGLDEEGRLLDAEDLQRGQGKSNWKGLP